MPFGTLRIAKPLAFNYKTEKTQKTNKNEFYLFDKKEAYKRKHQ